MSPIVAYAEPAGTTAAWVTIERSWLARPVMAGSPARTPFVPVVLIAVAASSTSTVELNWAINVWMFLVAVAVSWVVLRLVVPPESKVTFTPWTAPMTILELLNWSVDVTPFWVVVYFAATPATWAAPVRFSAANRLLPAASTRLMLCAPVLLLVRLTLSCLGSYVAVTPAAEELMRVRMLLMLSVFAQLMNTPLIAKLPLVEVSVVLSPALDSALLGCASPSSLAALRKLLVSVGEPNWSGEADVSETLLEPGTTLRVTAGPVRAAI